MKIAYNDDGTITTAALDSQEAVGVHTAIVPDNLDVFSYPAKYKYINGAFTLAPRLEATAASLTAVVGTSVHVTVQAKLLGGALDTSSTASIVVQQETGVATPKEFALVNGAASFDVTASTPGQIYAFPYSVGLYSEPIMIQFTAA